MVFFCLFGRDLG